MNLLNVLTVYRSGGDFSQEYVHRLARGVSRFLDTPHRFICLNDQRETFDTEHGIEWKLLKHDWPGKWAKAEIFRPDLEKYGRLLYIDLTAVIVGDLTDIASYSGESCVVSDFYYGGPSQSVLNFAPGSLREIWDEFNKRPEHWMAEGDKMIAPDFGDQILMRIKEPVDRFDPKQIVSYKVHCKFGVPEGARIVKFHGHPRPHECKDAWIESAWIKGIGGVADFEAVANVPDDVPLKNMEINCKRDLPWLMPRAEHDRSVILVGGGPSLAENVRKIRARKNRGQEIWAFNGTHDYLISKNIMPDVLMMADCRAENAMFVQKPRKDVRYHIASCCHPDVFEALEGHDVTVWHMNHDGAVDFLDKFYPKRPWCLFGGGNTVGTRALYVGRQTGFRKFHLYGFDSCYRAGNHHAYPQAMNDHQIASETMIGERTFMCASWMVNQAKAFQQQIRQMTDCEVTVHGNGLISYMVTLMNRSNDGNPV